MTTGQSPHPPSPSARARGVHDCNAQATWAKLKMCLFSQCHASFILSLFTCVMKLLIKYSPLIRVWVPGHLKYRIWETFGSQPVPAHRATLTLRDRRQTPSSSEYIFLEEMLVLWTAGHGWWSVICATFCNTHRAYYQIPICPENPWNMMSTSKVLCNPSHVATMGPLPFTDFRLWSQAWGRVHHGGLI